MNWHEIAASFLVPLLSAMIGGAIPAIVSAFRLGNKVGEMLEKIRQIVERCEHREKDHCHHYEKINAHEVRLGNLDTRVMSLETWRVREEN